MAPASVAFADFQKRLWLYIGLNGAVFLRLLAERQGRFSQREGGAPATEQRVMDPAHLPVEIADLSPRVVFKDDLHGQPLALVFPFHGIALSGAGAHENLIGGDGDEAWQGVRRGAKGRRCGGGRRIRARFLRPRAGIWRKTKPSEQKKQQYDDFFRVHSFVYDKKAPMNQAARNTIGKAPGRLPEISVAPMMDWTDRHCRYFHRLIARDVRLYTEMVTAGALIFGDRDRHLRFDGAERPVALQLGGSDPQALAECAAMGESYGYDEINLNCGCPSDRVQNGRFGACLMKEPAHVAACVAAMIREVSVPVTVKCRIGIDDQDDFAFLDRFVGSIADKGCTTFIIHARKAWLKGLSPKENREKPPIDYGRAAQIREKYPQLRIIVNGEISTLDNLKARIEVFDGAMIGREAYQNPWFLAEIAGAVFGAAERPGQREDIARAMADYAWGQLERYGTPVKSVARHMLGLFHGQPGAKAWKQALGTLVHAENADPGAILSALEARSLAASSTAAHAASS